MIILSGLKRIWNSKKDRKIAQKKAQDKQYGKIKKGNEKIILDEVKSRYARLINKQSEFNRKCHSLLQLDGLILSGMIICLGFTMEFISSNVSEFHEIRAYLLISMGLIISSIIALISIMTLTKTKKKIDEKLSNNRDMGKSEREIIKSLIKQYERAQDDINPKRNFVAGFIVFAVVCSMGSFPFFVQFIIEIIP